ncbi:MAG: ABC transporter transmembrane domain-containing protein, partial [Sediminibacterium sp.]
MTETSKKKVFDFSLLGRVFHFVRPYRGMFYLSLILAVVMALFAPIRPYLIQLTVDTATGKSVQIPGWLETVLFNTDFSDASRFIISVTLFQIVFLMLETSIRFIFSFITASMGQHVVKDLRVAVYKKVLGLNLRQFDQTPIGTLTTRT